MIIEKGAQESRFRLIDGLFIFAESVHAVNVIQDSVAAVYTCKEHFPEIADCGRTFIVDAVFEFDAFALCGCI